MALNTTDFSLHDVSHFPRVLAKGRPPAGYAAQWVREMEALVAHGECFVLIHAGARADEAHEDRKQRGLWLKHHKQTLGALCKALISVEPDNARRLALAAQSALAEKAFGIPMRTAPTLEQACKDAQAMLAAVR